MMPVSQISIAALRLTAVLVGHTSLADPSDVGSPATDTPIQTQQNQASWSRLEAEHRATNRDYDGAVQAQTQADQALRDASRLRAKGRNDH